MSYLEELARRAERTANQPVAAPAEAPDPVWTAQTAARDALKLGATETEAHEVYLKTYASVA